MQHACPRKDDWLGQPKKYQAGRVVQLEEPDRGSRLANSEYQIPEKSSQNQPPEVWWLEGVVWVRVRVLAVPYLNPPTQAVDLDWGLDCCNCTTSGASCSTRSVALLVRLGRTSVLADFPLLGVERFLRFGMTNDVQFARFTEIFFKQFL